MSVTLTNEDYKPKCIDLINQGKSFVEIMKILSGEYPKECRFDMERHKENDLKFLLYFFDSIVDDGFNRKAIGFEDVRDKVREIIGICRVQNEIYLKEHGENYIEETIEKIKSQK